MIEICVVSLSLINFIVMVITPDHFLKDMMINVMHRGAILQCM